MFDLQAALNEVQEGQASNNFQSSQFLEELNKMRGESDIGTFIRGLNGNLQTLNNAIDTNKLLPGLDISFDADAGRFTTETEHPGREAFVNDRSGEPGKIVPSAEGSVGRPVWKDSEVGDKTVNGDLGCAASVGEILQMAGYDYASSALVGGSPVRRGLVDVLKDYGWTVASTPKAGDVVYTPDVHIGIVGGLKHGEQQVLHNSGNRGQKVWTEQSLAESSLAGGLYLRPPVQG